MQNPQLQQLQSQQLQPILMTALPAPKTPVMRYVSMLIVVVLALLLVTKQAQAVPTTIGSGVSDTPGTGDTPTPSEPPIVSPPLPVLPKTKVIRITRVGVTAQSPAVEWSIGEARVYVDGNMLSKDDFASATYGNKSRGYNDAFPAWNALDGDVTTFTHTDVPMELYMDLTLKVPAVVSKVEVIGRHSCCEGRLANASVQLMGSNGTIHARFNLAQNREWQTFPVQY